MRHRIRGPRKCSIRPLRAQAGSIKLNQKWWDKLGDRRAPPDMSDHADLHNNVLGRRAVVGLIAIDNGLK